MSKEAQEGELDSQQHGYFSSRDDWGVDPFVFRKIEVGRV